MVLLILQLNSIPLKSKSKIGFFLFIMAFAISLSSCSKAKNDVIPDVFVNFTLDIYDPEFVSLTCNRFRYR